MVELSGTCTLSESPVSGAVVYVIDAGDETIEATTTSDGTGDYSFDLPGGTYHVAAEYEDGGDQYNALSKPFITLSTPVTTLEDWEGSSPLDDYRGATTAVSVQSSTVLEGSNSLQSDSDFSAIYADTGDKETPRGNEYRFHFQSPPAGSGAYIRWYTNVPSGTTGATVEGYMLQIREDNDTIELFYIDSSESLNSLGSTSVTIDGATEYHAGIVVDNTGVSGNLEGILYDSSESQIATTGTATDDNLTGGTFGWYFNRDDTYTDNIRQIPL